MTRKERLTTSRHAAEVPTIHEMLKNDVPIMDIARKINSITGESIQGLNAFIHHYKDIILEVDPSKYSVNKRIKFKGNKYRVVKKVRNTGDGLVRCKDLGLLFYFELHMIIGWIKWQNVDEVGRLGVQFSREYSRNGSKYEFNDKMLQISKKINKFLL